MKKSKFLLCVATLMLASICPAKKRSSASKDSTPSGIYGKVLRIGFPPINPDELGPGEHMAGEGVLMPDVVVVVRRLPDKKEVKRSRSNRDANFKINLPPGEYNVEPLFPMPAPPVPESFAPIPGSVRRVTVWRGFYTKAEAVFDDGW